MDMLNMPALGVKIIQKNNDAVKNRSQKIRHKPLFHVCMHDKHFFLSGAVFLKKCPTVKPAHKTPYMGSWKTVYLNISIFTLEQTYCLTLSYKQ